MQKHFLMMGKLICHYNNHINFYNRIKDVFSKLIFYVEMELKFSKKSPCNFNIFTSSRYINTGSDSLCMYNQIRATWIRLRFSGRFEEHGRFAIDDRSHCGKIHPITDGECGGLCGSTYICNNICYDKSFTRELRYPNTKFACLKIHKRE